MACLPCAGVFEREAKREKNLEKRAMEIARRARQTEAEARATPAGKDGTGAGAGGAGGKGGAKDEKMEEILRKVDAEFLAMIKDAEEEETKAVDDTA